jgi:hypothetical protein
MPREALLMGCCSWIGRVFSSRISDSVLGIDFSTLSFHGVGIYKEEMAWLVICSMASDMGGGRCLIRSTVTEEKPVLLLADFPLQYEDHSSLEMGCDMDSCISASMAGVEWSLGCSRTCGRTVRRAAWRCAGARRLRSAGEGSSVAVAKSLRACRPSSESCQSRYSVKSPSPSISSEK